MSKTIAIDARKLQDFGIGTYIRNLIRHLAQLDSEHRYLLLVASEETLESDLGPLPRRFATVIEPATVYSAGELLSVSRTLKRIDADLYHATHYTLPLRPPCRCVVTIHDLIHLLFPEFLPNRLALTYARVMLKRAARIASRVIAVSNHTAMDLEQHLAIPSDRIDVIHNGVSSDFSTPATDTERKNMFKRHGLEPGYLLFVGNPKPHKNLERVLEAYRLAKTANRDLGQLVCAGTGADAGRIAEKAAALGIADSVRLPGFIDGWQMPTLYQAATMFVFPGLYEGFGLPVAEAMAAGTPVITSTNSALSEVAGDAALLVDPLDTTAIADAIGTLFTQADQRYRLRDLGLEQVRRFQWSNCAQQTLASYDRVLAH